MRIRPIWVLVPSFAAAGVFTYSIVSAQETPPPFGYYPPKVSPSTSTNGQGSTYIRPLNGPGQNSYPAPPAGTADYGSGLPAPTVTYPDPATGRTKLTQLVTAGPTGKTAPTVRLASATEPIVNVPSPKFNVEPPAPTLKMIPPDANLAPRVPSPSFGTPLPPPKLTVESSMPTEPKPLPLTAPIQYGPTPLIPVLSAPPAIAIVPVVTPPTLTPPTLTPPGVPGGPTMLVPVPSMAAEPLEAKAPTTRTASNPFPTSPQSAKSSPTIGLEVIAPETIGVGQNLTYELVVRNTGATSVANVRVEEEISAGAKFVSSDPGSERSGERLTWTLGDIDAGGEKRIKITVKPADEGEVRSRAIATFTTATEARVKVTRPKIGLSVKGIESARVGDEVAFQIRIANTGTGTAAKLMLQAKLSDGLHHPQGGVIEAEILNLTAGESKTITLRALATKAGAHSCSIVASADGNPAETTQATTTIVEPILQAKLTGPARCMVRAEPEFKIDLANPGTTATDPVQVWAVVPEGFEYVQASDGGNYQAASRTVMWKLAAMGTGSTKSLSMKLRAAAATEATIKIVAQAAAPVPNAMETNGVIPAGGRGAGRVLEAKAEAIVKAEGVPAIRFEVIDIEDPVEAGKEAIYEIKVVNQGTAACTNVIIAATLAEGTAATGATGPTQARGQGQSLNFDGIASLAPKQEASFRVRVKGNLAGDLKFKVQLTCDEIRTPIVKEENTRFLKE